MNTKTIDEVMALVFKLVHAERYGYYDAAKDRHEDAIRAKLQELERRPASDSQVIDAALYTCPNSDEHSSFIRGMRYAERFHNIGVEE